MEGIIAWWTENWWWCVPLILSEALPYIRNTEANGIAQGLINVIRKAGRKSGALVILCLLAAGCTTINVTPPQMSAGGTYTLTIDASRTVPFTASPSGNTVPLR